MYKIFAFIIPFLLCAILPSCDDDKTPELKFSEVSNTAPEHIQFSVTSPDPACVPYRATIYADRFGGELTIKCTNAAKFYLGYMSDPDNYFTTDPMEGVESDPDYYYSEQGRWSARLVNNNTLVFNFEAMDADATEDWTSLPVCATVHGKVVNTGISICRTYGYLFYE